MLTAGITLLINTGIILLAWGLVRARKSHLDAALPKVWAILINVVCALGLLRGLQRARRWALVFAILGGLASLVAPIIGIMEFNWPIGILQAVYMGGIVIMLAGENASIKRVIAGVCAVIIGWGGTFTVGFIQGIRKVLPSTGVEAYVLADRSFSEEQFGIGLDLPPGWSFLSKSNPVIKTEDAIALAFHRKSGRFATLIVELVSDEGVALTNISTC